MTDSTLASEPCSARQTQHLTKSSQPKIISLKQMKHDPRLVAGVIASVRKSHPSGDPERPSHIRLPSLGPRHCNPGETRKATRPSSLTPAMNRTTHLLLHVVRKSRCSPRFSTAPRNARSPCAEKNASSVMSAASRTRFLASSRDALAVPLGRFFSAAAALQQGLLPSVVRINENARLAPRDRSWKIF